MTWIVLFGWIVEVAGTFLWLYGYFSIGHRSIVNWHDSTPWWIADYLPNIESEIGMALVLAGMVPIYWPPRE